VKKINRRQALAVTGGAVATILARPAAAQEETERHGMSAFGDLKYPPDFQHFDYVNPDAPKGGVFSALASVRQFNQNFTTFKYVECPDPDRRFAPRHRSHLRNPDGAGDDLRANP
jgi:microcin C transport system substrate-binding protein